MADVAFAGKKSAGAATAAKSAATQAKMQRQQANAATKSKQVVQRNYKPPSVAAPQKGPAAPTITPKAAAPAPTPKPAATPAPKAAVPPPTGGAGGGQEPRAPNGKFASEAKRRLDWLPEKQFKQQQKGLKKAVAARKRSDKAPTPYVPGSKFAGPKVEMGGPGSGPHAVTPMQKAMQAGRKIANPGHLKMPEPGHLKIESKPDHIKVTARGTARAGLSKVLQHIVHAVGPHLSEDTPVKPSPDQQVVDNRTTKRTNPSGTTHPIGNRTVRKVGSPAMADEVVDNRNGQRGTNPLRIKPPKGSAPAPGKSIGAIHVAPSAAAPAGGGGK